MKGVFEDIELSEKKKRSIESLLTQKLTGRLKEFKRKEYDADVGEINILSSDFLFVGNPAQVYEDVIISNYIPR